MFRGDSSGSGWYKSMVWAEFNMFILFIPEWLFALLFKKLSSACISLVAHTLIYFEYGFQYLYHIFLIKRESSVFCPRVMFWLDFYVRLMGYSTAAQAASFCFWVAELLSCMAFNMRRLHAFCLCLCLCSCSLFGFGALMWAIMGL